MNCLCPASMCPLVAKDGSPWTGEKDAPCPEQDDINNGGCPFWSMACGTGAIHQQVNEAETKQVLILGPNKPRHSQRKPSTYICDKENVCSWQKHATQNNTGGGLCPPRYALSKGLDPRVCLF